MIYIHMIYMYIYIFDFIIYIFTYIIIYFSNWDFQISLGTEIVPIRHGKALSWGLQQVTQGTANIALVHGKVCILKPVACREGSGS